MQNTTKILNYKNTTTYNSILYSQLDDKYRKIILYSMPIYQQIKFLYFFNFFNSSYPRPSKS